MTSSALKNTIQWAVLAFALPMAAAGCAMETSAAADEEETELASTDDYDDASTEEEEDIASTAQALSACGTKPPGGGGCNTWMCLDGGWELVPAPVGKLCYTNGQQGQCDGGSATELGKCVANITGALFPSYYVLTVMYAPPGASSNVSYGQGTTFGTTTSTVSSWSNLLSVTVSNKAELPIIGSSDLSVTGSWEQAGSNTDSYDVKSTTNTTFNINGIQDGIDHDVDRIYLWLNPQVDVVSNSVDNSLKWSMKVRDGQYPVIQYVYVRWLRDPSTMPANVASVLQSAGVTPAEYPEILKINPLWNSTNFDVYRYKYQTTIAYIPPATPEQRPTMTSYGVSKTTTTGTTTTSSTELSVKVQLSGSLEFLGFAEAKMTVADTLKWKYSNTYSSTAASTLSATVNIQQPSYYYTGSTLLDVYLDTAFNTFVFKFR